MAANEEKKRTRSPAYPCMNLEEAIAYAKQAYVEEDRHAFTPEAAATHWGYKSTSSAVSQIVSALKQFGLLVELDSNGTRRVRLSPLALDLMVHEGESDLVRRERLKTAALNPKIHREIWDKYGGRLPSDTSLRIYLLREREGVPFNKDQVDKFISQMRATIEFAKLSESDKLPQEADDLGGKEVKKETSWLSDISADTFPSSSKPPEPKQSGRCSVQAEPGFQQAVFPLNGGEAVVQWPEHISPTEFQDFEDWLALVVRKVKRSVQQERRLDAPSGGATQDVIDLGNSGQG